VPTLEIQFLINIFNILWKNRRSSECLKDSQETKQEGLCRQVNPANGKRLPFVIQFSSNGTFITKIALE